MAEGIALTTRVCRWMGSFAQRHPVISKAARVLLPFGSAGAVAGVGVYLQYGDEKALAAVLGLGVGEVVARAIRGNVKIAKLESEGNAARVRELEKHLRHREEQVDYLGRELEESRKGGVSAGAGLRYDLVEPLGRGAQAIVLLVKDQAVNQLRVMKVPSLDEALRYYPGNLKRFMNMVRVEAENLCKLDHSNIVKFFHYDEMTLEAYMALTGEKIDPQALQKEGVDKIPFIVMERVKGTSLESKLAEMKREGYKGFPLSQAASKMLKLCSALMETKTKDVTHRDLKPANVVLTPDGELKLLDFGIARGLKGSGTTVGVPMGTPGYMAPEQMGERVQLLVEKKLGRSFEVSPVSDLHGAGAILWEMLTLEQPFTAAQKVWDLAYNDPRSFENKMREGLQALGMPAPKIEDKLGEGQDRLLMDLDMLLERIDPRGVNHELRQSQMELKVLQKNILFRLQKVFNKTMDVDPRKRYNDLEEMKKDLLQILEDNESYQAGLRKLARSGSLAFETTAVQSDPVR